MSSAPVGVSVTDQGTTATVTATGELDLTTQPELADSLPHVQPGGRLVLDFRGLTFIDSTGVKAIITSRQLCADHGQEFCLIRAAGHVHRIFEVTGLDKRLPFA